MKTMITNYYSDMVTLATIASAWAAMSLAAGTAALCWDRKEKIGVWFSRGMLSLACTVIGFAIGVLILTAGRWLIAGAAH